MKTITLYHDPKQSVLHIIMAEVDKETGHHQVVDSTITTVIGLNLSRLAREYTEMVGEPNVRAYTITEVEF